MPCRDEIPVGLLGHISEFRLPCGAVIRRMRSSHYELDGWVLCPRGIDRQYMYADGEVAFAPRHRAYQELGYRSGEDSFTCEEDWQCCERKERELTGLLIMTLPAAYALAVEHGYANRLAQTGEPATLRADGRRVTVIHPGYDNDPVRILQVDADGDDFRVHLSDLLLDDDDSARSADALGMVEKQDAQRRVQQTVKRGRVSPTDAVPFW